jgi:isoquinoline 1-oxidoreductase alpha subunit
MIEFILSGATGRTDGDSNTPLPWLGRGTFKLKGFKFGCGVGLCGVGTMHIDGEASRTCVPPGSAEVDAAMSGDTLFSNCVKVL